MYYKGVLRAVMRRTETLEKCEFCDVALYSQIAIHITRKSKRHLLTVLRKMVTDLHIQTTEDSSDFYKVILPNHPPTGFLTPVPPVQDRRA